MTGGKWTIMVITIERYFAFSRPFAQRVRETRSIKMILMIITFCSLLINVPATLELTTIQCYSNVSHEIKAQISPTKLRGDETYKLVYRIIILTIFENSLPFALVLILTVRILIVRPSLDRNENEFPLFRNRVQNDTVKFLKNGY